jgi:hypothetical protein
MTEHDVAWYALKSYPLLGRDCEYYWVCKCGERYDYKHFAAQNVTVHQALGWAFLKHAGHRWSMTAWEEHFLRVF